MNSNTIFTVRNEDLLRLNPNTAVEFSQKLLWAEARRLGIEISKINISHWVNVPDGGVDAAVDEVEIAGGQGLIKSGKTSYQIKAGASFKPWQKSVIKDELFGSSGNLGDSIRACLEDHGTYILVCTGIDLVDSQYRDTIKHIEDFLKQCGYSDPKVEVWSQNTLIGFLQVFPSLALLVNGRDRSDFQTHQSWAMDANMQAFYVPGEGQHDSIAKIRDELRQNYDTVHVRVLGEPGIGKTRLVLEATRAEDLAPLVTYCTAAQFRGSELMREILREDSQLSTIIVIDECDRSSSSDFWDKLRHRGPRIKLISIHNDHEDRAGDITYHDTPSLNDEQIRSIIQEHTSISDAQADRWGELCSGSPRVAHVIGENLVNHPEDLLKPPGTVEIWERYVAAGDDREKTDHRRLVLQHLALFKRFGYERSVAKEAETIAKKIEAANRDITLHEFDNIIYELRGRRILQGESTLYITPKALQIWLWTQWWERHHVRFDLEDFTEGLTPKLVEWFYEMFVYAAESEAALEIVEKLLGPDGPFHDNEYLKTRLGSRFFLALAEANPKSALRCLMRTMGTWDRNTLFQFTTGRRDVVWALEKIAMQRDLFADAARLLLALGEAENEGWSNNASGIFAGLFSPGRGRVAPTEASPTERLPVLKEAFESGSKERRLLALKACNEGLELDRFSRMSGAEYRGLRNDIDFWEPKTYGELFDAYRQIWELLSEQLERLPADEREETIGILLQRAPRIAKRPNLSNMVVDTIQMLSEKTYVDNRWLIKTVVEFLRHNGKDLPDDIRRRWEHLRDELVGSDFHSMMQRYVAMNLNIDAFDENENYFEEGHPQIQALAQQAVEEPHLLQSELQWLVTAEAHNGYAFGYQLGKKDNGFVILPVLLDAQRKAVENASVFFLGGYFRALFEGNIAAWEEQLDTLVEDTRLNALTPELTYLSGLTDRAGLRLLKLAKAEIMDIKYFASFFSKRMTDNLSEKVFIEWIAFLLDYSDNLAVSIALKLYYFYFIYDKKEPTPPRDLTFQLLTRPTLFENLPVLYQRSQLGNSMTDSHWADITKAFLNLYPEKDLELIEQVLPHFGKKGTIFGTFTNTDASSVMTELAKRHPEQVWKHVSKRLEEYDFFLENWLKEGASEDSFSTTDERGVLTLIPREKIWEWIDGNVADRAWYFAYSLVPKTLSAEKWPNSLVRAFLVRYGDREDVRRNLSANYGTGMWEGLRSLHYEEKRDKLLRINEGEDNGNVKRWLDEYIERLEEDIEHARIDEEREF